MAKVVEIEVLERTSYKYRRVFSGEGGGKEGKEGEGKEGQLGSVKR